MNRSRLRAGILAGVVAVVVSCSDSEPAPAAAPPPLLPTAVSQEPGPVAEESGTTVEVAQHPDLGSILVDGEGFTLYLFTRDDSSTSNCTGGCARTWPPLVVAQGSDAVAGEGVNAALFGAITRGDGASQVTYNGHPLYTFAVDKEAGEAKGHGSGGIWFAVSPGGEPAK